MFKDKRFRCDDGENNAKDLCRPYSAGKTGTETRRNQPHQINMIVMLEWRTPPGVFWNILVGAILELFGDPYMDSLPGRRMQGAKKTARIFQYSCYLVLSEPGIFMNYVELDISA